jgi:hypothetical protein
MAGISNYLANKINDWLHGNTAAYTPPATTYFALMLAMPTASGGGTEVASSGSYVRKAVTNNSTNWPASSSGIKTNGAAISWITPTGDWGRVVGIAEYDASTGGNLLTFADLSTATTVLSGQVFSLPTGSASFTWSGGISQYLANKLNDWLHGGGTYTVPATTYFAPMTVIPTATTPGTETSGGSYARSADTNNATDWPDSIGQSKTNANTLSWPTASTNWSGPEVAVAEYDASSGGNQLTFGALANNITVASGATPSIPAGGAVYTVQ